MVLDIVQLGSPILRQMAREISKEEIGSKEIQGLIEAMKETMRAAPGVGLAAPQVGVPIKLAVIEDRVELIQGMSSEVLEERGRRSVPFHVIINPTLTVLNDEKVNFFEACLSVTGCSRVTPRAKEVLVECLDENGDEKTFKATGWYARILQHEIDHLNGKLYIDIADKKTEILQNEENRARWFNASSEDIAMYLKERGL